MRGLGKVRTKKNFFSELTSNLCNEELATPCTVQLGKSRILWVHLTPVCRWRLFWRHFDRWRRRISCVNADAHKRRIPDSHPPKNLIRLIQVETEEREELSGFGTASRTKPQSSKKRPKMPLKKAFRSNCQRSLPPPCYSAEAEEDEGSRRREVRIN